MAYKLQAMLNALWQDNVQQSQTELELAAYTTITPGAVSATPSSKCSNQSSRQRATKSASMPLTTQSAESLCSTQNGADDLGYALHSAQQDEWDPNEIFSAYSWLGTAHQCLNVHQCPKALHTTLQHIYAEGTPESAFYQSVLLTHAYMNIEKARYPTQLIPLKPVTQTSNSIAELSPALNSSLVSGSGSSLASGPESGLDQSLASGSGTSLGSEFGQSLASWLEAAQDKSEDDSQLTIGDLLGAYHNLSFVKKRCEFLSPKLSDFLIRLREQSLPVLFWALRKLALTNKVMHPQYVNTFMHQPLYETIPCDALRYCNSLILPGFYFEEGHFAYTDWMLKEVFLRVAGPLALIECDWAIPEIAKWALKNSPRQTLHLSPNAWDYPAIFKAHLEANSIKDVINMLATLRFQDPALARQLFVQYFAQIPEGSALVETLEVNLTLEDEDVLLSIIRNELCAESALDLPQDMPKDTPQETPPTSSAGTDAEASTGVSAQATTNDGLNSADKVPNDVQSQAMAEAQAQSQAQTKTQAQAEAKAQSQAKANAAYANSKEQKQARTYAWNLLSHLCGGKLSLMSLQILQKRYVYQDDAWVKQDVMSDLDHLDFQAWLTQGLIDDREYEQGSNLVALLKRRVTSKRQREFEEWLKRIEIRLLWCLDLDGLISFTRASSSLEAIHRLLKLLSDRSWETYELSALWMLPQKILDAKDSQAAEDLLIRSKLMFPELNLKDKFDLIQSMMPLIWLLSPSQRTMVGWHLLDEMHVLYSSKEYRQCRREHPAPYYRDDNNGVYAPSSFSWCTPESGGQAYDFVQFNELTLLHKFLEQPDLNFESYKIANGSAWDNNIAASLALTLPYSEIDWLEQEILRLKEKVQVQSDSNYVVAELKRHLAFLQRIQKFLKLKKRADELLQQELADSYLEDSLLPSLQPLTIKQLQQRTNQRLAWLQ